MPDQPHRVPIQTFWTIWIAILGWMILNQYRVGGGIPQGKNIENNYGPLPFLILAAIMAVSSIVIRWFAIPGKVDRKTLLVLMIIGLALANSISYYGVYLIRPEYPQTKVAFFFASFFCILQFAPIFVRQTENTPEDSS